MTNTDLTTIWGLHRITGYWTPLRQSVSDEIQQWLDAFRKYESEKYKEFAASKKRPPYTESQFDRK